VLSAALADVPWANEPWAADADGGAAAARDPLNDSALWDGVWTPEAEVGDYRLFDERAHPQVLAMRSHRAGAGTLPMPVLSEVSNFIRSLSQTARMGAEASVVGLAYLERLISSGGFPLDQATWRRAAIAAWLLASKMWDDDCFENRDFAALFGHDIDDLNALEQAFVKAIGFRMNVSPAEYARYYFALRSICQTTTEAFPLRPLDAELEARLEQRAAAISGNARGRWAQIESEGFDLTRSL